MTGARESGSQPSSSSAYKAWAAAVVIEGGLFLLSRAAEAGLRGDRSFEVSFPKEVSCLKQRTILEHCRSSARF
jgi:hypothetical protein